MDSNQNDRVQPENLSESAAHAGRSVLATEAFSDPGRDVHVGGRIATGMPAGPVDGQRDVPGGKGIPAVGGKGLPDIVLEDIAKGAAAGAAEGVIAGISRMEELSFHNLDKSVRVGSPVHEGKHGGKHGDKPNHGHGGHGEKPHGGHGEKEDKLSPLELGQPIPIEAKVQKTQKS